MRAKHHLSAFFLLFAAPEALCICRCSIVFGLGLVLYGICCIIVIVRDFIYKVGPMVLCLTPLLEILFPLLYLFRLYSSICANLAMKPHSLQVGFPLNIHYI
jgi:hypothetical protein